VTLYFLFTEFICITESELVLISVGIVKTQFLAFSLSASVISVFNFGNNCIIDDELVFTSIVAITEMFFLKK